MAKIGYLCVGTNDFDKATAFYTELLAEIGGKPLMPTSQGLIYRLKEGAMLMVTKPHDGQAATIGNGTMVAIQLDARDQVKSVYDKALALGGTCEGEPGPRGAFGDFAYFRDLDGNKLAVYYSENF